MTAKSSRYPAFTYHDFRLLWIGQLLSNMGTQMQFTALNWHIYLLTHSAFALGLIGLARFIPILVFSLFGGVTADAFNRKKTLLTTQIILTILASILAITTLSGHITPPLIYLITVLSTIVFAFDGPTRQAFFPSLVDREHLPNAVSLNSVMFQTSTIVGPGVAGFIIASMGIGSVYAINALSYLAVITALLMMFATGEIAGKKTKIAFSSIVEGFVFVKSQTLIWSTMHFCQFLLKIFFTWALKDLAYYPQLLRLVL
jgi:MFS family permease